MRSVRGWLRDIEKGTKGSVMRNVFIFLGLVVVLGGVGFFAGGTICESIQGDEPEITESKSAYANRSPDWRIQQRQNIVVERSIQRGTWAFIGGGIGAGAGCIAGLIIIVILGQKEEAKAAPPSRRRPARMTGDQAASALADIASASSE